MAFQNVTRLSYLLIYFLPAGFNLFLHSILFLSIPLSIRSAIQFFSFYVIFSFFFHCSFYLCLSPFFLSSPYCDQHFLKQLNCSANLYRYVVSLPSFQSLLFFVLNQRSECCLFFYTIFCQNPLSTNRKIFKYKSLYRAILGMTFKSHVRPKGQPTCQSEQRRFY